MGLLDEAIREHLELKRKHGAREVEVQELEQEAFGPSLQTGELPASPQAAVVSELAPTAPTEIEPDHEAEPPPVRPQPPTQEFTVPEPPPPPPPGTEEHALPFGQGQPEGEHPVEIESYEPPPAAEPPRDKMEESLSVITEGGGPSADFYDFDDDEVEPVDEVEPEAAVEPGEPAAYEQPVEEPQVTEPPPEAERSSEAEPAPEAEPLPEADYESEPPEEEPYEETGEGPPAVFDVESEGDVLEETPEFLREQPDDDELWFEQRPPKDFDL